MPEDRVRPEHPEIVQERDRRLAVRGEHPLKLHHVLGGVDLHQHAEAFGDGPGSVEQLGGAGVGLGRAEHAPNPAAGDTVDGAQDGLGPFKLREAPGLIPVPHDRAALVEGVAGAGAVRAGVEADADVDRDLRERLARAAKLQGGGGAAPDQLGQGVGAADPGLFEPDRPLLAARDGPVVEEAGLEELGIADVGDHPLAGLAAGVAVDIHQARDDQAVTGVDGDVGRPGVPSPHEGDLAVLAEHLARSEQPVRPFVERDDRAALDQRRRHRRITSPRGKGTPEGIGKRGQVIGVHPYHLSPIP